MSERLRAGSQQVPEGTPRTGLLADQDIVIFLLPAVEIETTMYLLVA